LGLYGTTTGRRGVIPKSPLFPLGPEKLIGAIQNEGRGRSHREISSLHFQKGCCEIRNHLTGVGLFVNRYISFTGGSEVRPQDG